MSEVLKAAQEETQNILVNLTRGHEDLLCETTVNKLRPTYFAWSNAGIEGLKRMSEMNAAFPEHDLSAGHNARPAPFKPKVGSSPIITNDKFEVANWNSENHTNYAPVEERADEVDEQPAGFHNLDSVDLPVQFAWKRLDEDEASPGMC
jgi:hypothetical protein